VEEEEDEEVLGGEGKGEEELGNASSGLSLSLEHAAKNVFSIKSHRPPSQLQQTTTTSAPS